MTNGAHTHAFLDNFIHANMNIIKLDSSLFEEEDIQFQQIEGVIFGRRQNQEHLNKIRNFQLADQDVLCATYPKAGMYMTCTTHAYENVRHPNMLNVTTHSKPFPADGIYLRRG